MSQSTTDRSSRCTARPPRARRAVGCRGVGGPSSSHLLRRGLAPLTEVESDGVPAVGRGEGCADPTAVVAVPLVRDVTPVDVRRRDGGRLVGDAGMATAEYAIATLAACGFAGLLLALLASDQVRGLLLGIVQRALTVG